VGNFKWGLTAAAAALFISVGLGMISGVQTVHILIRALIFMVVFFGLGFSVQFIVHNFFPELLSSENVMTGYDTNEQPGSRVNITLDSTGEYAVPELYKLPGESHELGNIEDLVSGVFKPRSQEGIDRKEEQGYNIGSNVKISPFQEKDDFLDTAVFDKPREEKPAFTPNFGDGSDDLGGLPDLDALAMSFSKGESHAANPSPFDIGIGGGSTGGLPDIKDDEALDDAMFFKLDDSSDFDSSMEPDDLEPVDDTRYVGNKPQTLKGDFNPKDLAEGIRTVLNKDK
jgi:hypothetical protein